jgi:acetyl esterase/lipase
MNLDWNAATQDQRDAAYDNNRAVANSADLIARRNAASASFRASRSEHLDLAYGPRPRNQIDLFVGHDPNAPCLVFLHGGYWQRNRREDFSAFAAGIMAHGWSVAMPGYSLAPDVTLTDIVAEIDAALSWLARNIGAHGVSSRRLVVSGWSAGGHLAAMALGHPAVAAGFSISGVFDLGPIRDTYLNEKLQLTDEEVQTLSPLRLEPVNKPFTLAYGTRELWPLVRDSRELHERRAVAHTPGALVPMPDADHFTILEDLMKPGGQLVMQILALG